MSVQAAAVPVRERPPCIRNAISVKAYPVKAAPVKAAPVKAYAFSSTAGKLSSASQDRSQPILRSVPLVTANRFATLPLEIDSTPTPLIKSPRDTVVPMTKTLKKPGSSRFFGIAAIVASLLLVAFLGMHTVGGVSSSVPDFAVRSSTTSVSLPSQVRSSVLAFTSLPRSSLPLLRVGFWRGAAE